MTDGMETCGTAPYERPRGCFHPPAMAADPQGACPAASSHSRNSAFWLSSSFCRAFTSRLLGGDVALSGQCGGTAGGVPHGHRGGHRPGGLERPLLAGDAAARQHEALDLLRHEGTIGNVEAFVLEEEPLAVIARHRIGADRDDIREMRALDGVLLGDGAFAENSAGLANADAGGRLQEIHAIPLPGLFAKLLDLLPQLDPPLGLGPRQIFDVQPVAAEARAPLDDAVADANPAMGVSAIESHRMLTDGRMPLAYWAAL